MLGSTVKEEATGVRTRGVVSGVFERGLLLLRREGGGGGSMLGERDEREEQL